MLTIITALGLSLLFFQSSGRGARSDRDFEELSGTVQSVRIEAEHLRDQSEGPKGNARFLEKIAAYDTSGRVLEEVRGLGNVCISSRHVFSHDAEGNRTEAIFRGKAAVAGDNSDPSQTGAAPGFDATKLAPCPPAIIRKSGGVLQGSATKRVEPFYPPNAVAARIFGSVVVEVTVNEVGRVISARAISGPAELREAAVDAARRWEFSPTMLSGWPVKVIGTITFNFNL